ncbi:Glutamate decarboxylase 1 [Aix galericulata]|nr:Glutamate decarboxylase 1 [Aix galericulata]
MRTNSLEDKGRIVSSLKERRSSKSLLACENSEKESRFRRTETDFSNLYARDLLPAKNGEEQTMQFLLEVVDILLNYVRKTFDRSTKVLDFHHPHQLLEGMEGFNLELSDNPESLEQILVDCRDTLKYGVRTGHPRFFNQLSTGLDIIGLAGEWLTSTANTNMFTYEIAPVFVLMEQITLRKMREIIGWSNKDGDGIFSPGGAISNMYSIMAARYKYFPEVKTKGMAAVPKLVLFTSEHSHYSIKKAGAALGFGTDNGYIPLFVNATAGTTVYGAFDPIQEIADICEKYNLWLHVDAAWGGGLLMSRKHRHKLNGIERANSVTWNPHKMMGVLLQCSAILVREKGILQGCNQMCAGYLFQQDKQYDVSYDTGDKAIQCGRHVDIFKFWLMWKAKGTVGFENQINKCLELAEYLYTKIKNREEFEMVFEGEPEHTNVCFWYIPPSLRGMPDCDERREKLHRVAPKIKALMMESGTTMVGYQPQGDKVNFFRMVISNPAATKSDIDFLIEEIERLGQELSVEGQTATGSRYFHPAGPTGFLLRMLSHIFGWLKKKYAEKKKKRKKKTLISIELRALHLGNLPAGAISSKLTKSSKEETEITGLCHRELGIQENVHDSNLQQECLFLSHLLTKTIKKASGQFLKRKILWLALIILPAAYAIKYHFYEDFKQITAARGAVPDNNQSMTTLTTSLICPHVRSSGGKAESNSASYLPPYRDAVCCLILLTLWLFPPPDIRKLLHVTAFATPTIQKGLRRESKLLFFSHSISCSAEGCWPVLKAFEIHPLQRGAEICRVTNNVTAERAGKSSRRENGELGCQRAWPASAECEAAAVNCLATETAKEGLAWQRQLTGRAAPA